MGSGDVGLRDEFGDGDTDEDEDGSGGGARPRRSPVTRKDVIQAKTGSRVSRSAVCVEGRMDWAQL